MMREHENTECTPDFTVHDCAVTVVVRCNFYLIYYRLLERSVPIYSFHVIYKGHRFVKIGVGD